MSGTATLHSAASAASAASVGDAERMVAELERVPVGPELVAALVELQEGQPGGVGDAYLQARVAAC